MKRLNCRFASTLFSVFLVIAVVPLTANAAEAINYVIETVAKDLDKPYAMEFLPNGDALVTEKSNQLRIIRNGKLLPTPVTGVPDVLVEGHYNGLLDIILHPRFTENHFIYLSHTYGSKNENTTRVIRARYINKKLEDVTEVFTAYPMKKTLNHPGGHLAFLKDETLLLTIGEGFEYREKAQDLNSMLGKIVRVTDDGKIPKDNPFKDAEGNPSPVWTYGHRHSQGIHYDSLADVVYEHEHGPLGGDELNLILRGKNYGWPMATYGLDYSGAYVSPFKKYPNTEQPLVYWTPSLAPCSMAQCRNCLWSEWEGDLFIGMLAGQQVRRVSVKNGIVTHQESIFSEIEERIRHVQFSPQGALYVITDSLKSGRVLRITPKKIVTGNQ